MKNRSKENSKNLLYNFNLVPKAFRVCSCAYRFNSSSILASRSLKTRTSASAPAAPLSVPDNSDDVDIVDDK